MTSLDIAHRRLHNQHISRAAFDRPADEVGWLVAVQAQDYAGAKWALGLRLRNAVDADVEQAFTDGSILRTHVMRPTWHFVTPADIRWLLALTAPRVLALNAYQHRQLELDRAVFKRSHAALVKALRGGKQLTREELRGVLQRAGIVTQGALRLAYILMRAELDGLICSGPRRGKQFTYALLEERVPPARTLERDEALAELVRRYFTSHGPARLQDFAWWSGLTTADARIGLEVVKGGLSQAIVDDKTYWFSESAPPVKGKSPTAYLLPNYDEYGISYRDHTAVFDPSNTNNLIFSYLLVLNGRLVGTWKRTLQKNAVVIESNTFTPLMKAEKRAVAAAARQYGVFLGLPVVLA